MLIPRIKSRQARPTRTRQWQQDITYNKRTEHVAISWFVQVVDEPYRTCGLGWSEDTAKVPSRRHQLTFMGAVAPELPKLGLNEVSNNHQMHAFL